MTFAYCCCETVLALVAVDLQFGRNRPQAQNLSVLSTSGLYGNAGTRSCLAAVDEEVFNRIRRCPDDKALTARSTVLFSRPMLLIVRSCVCTVQNLFHAVSTFTDSGLESQLPVTGTTNHGFSVTDCYRMSIVFWGFCMND